MEALTHEQVAIAIRQMTNLAEGKLGAILLEADVSVVSLFYQYYLGVRDACYALAQNLNINREVLKVKNVDWEIDGDILTIKIDLRKRFGLSTSGKSEIIASTEGDVSPDETNRPLLRVGLNVYEKRG